MVRKSGRNFSEKYVKTQIRNEEIERMLFFQLVKAYHIKWAQLKTDPNIAKWCVHLIELDQNKRHLDCARLRTFWESLDQYVL